MRREVGTAVMLAFLSGALLAGCSGLGDGLGDTPLSTVPGTVEYIAARGGNTSLGNGNDGTGRGAADGFPGSIGNSNTGNNNNGGGGGNNNNAINPNAPVAPFVGLGTKGIRLYAGCKGDPTVDLTFVPDYDCSDFLCRTQAQFFFNQLNVAQPFNGDCHDLDRDGNGFACEELSIVCPPP